MIRRCGLAAAVALGAVLAATLGGCVGIETTFDFSTDGSGTAAMVYRVSQFVTKLASAQGEEGGVPLPITEGEFDEAVSEAPGVSLVGGVKRSEDEEDITVEATLRFDRVESLASVKGFAGMPATLTREGDRWVFRQVLTAGGEGSDPVDGETMEIAEALFSGYDVVFVVQAPADVKSANRGKITGRTVRYSISVPELMRVTQPMELEVVW